MTVSEDNLDRWTSCWQQNKTLWNRHAPHQNASKILQLIRQYSGNNPSYNLYVPGCGHAHEAAFFANEKFNVIAVDFVEEAIKAAQNLYNEIPRLSFRTANVFNVDENEKYFFDVILDKSLWIVIHPNNRSRYASSCAQRLKNNGLFVAIINMKVPEKREPPYPVSPDEMQKIFKDEFILLFREEHQQKIDHEISSYEIIEVWQKK